MMSVRFHLDEHVADAVAHGLRRRGIDVTTTADAGLLGASDDEHVAYALAEGRVIFTNDWDYLELHNRGVPHAGIIDCRPNRRSIGEIVLGLALVRACYTPDEIRGRVDYV